MELDSGLLFATDELFHIFGLQPCEGPANVVEMCARVHDEDLPRLLQVFEEACGARTDYSCTFRIRRGTGRYRMVKAVGTFQPVCGEAGAITGMTYEIICEQPPVGNHS